MFKTILTYGLIGGLVAGVPQSIVALAVQGHSGTKMAVGYLIMLIALSTIFFAIKRHRDRSQGGVIRFWPAFGMGLGISLIAGLVYAAAWDIACLVTHTDFAGDYAQSVIAHEQASGASAAALAKVTAEMQSFKESYANPLYRWPMTIAEILPVGVLVSLISAVLLRNNRFLPAR